MFFMILIGIAVGLMLYAIAPGLTKWEYTGIRLLILPLVVGVGYEFIMYAGRHNGIIVRMLSAPGLWVQRLTTKEPTLDMLEVAIVSTKCALRDQFPEFMEFYNNREWEKKEATEESADTEAAETPEADASQDGAATEAASVGSAETAVSEGVDSSLTESATAAADASEVQESATVNTEENTSRDEQ